MKFYQQEIPGVYLIECEPVRDERGLFFRNFCQKEFHEHGLESKIVQTNISQNHKMHTLRGFHYQEKPFQEHKTMFCLSGSIQDVIVDLRPGSATFLKWQTFDLTADVPVALHLPAGCANAFLTLKDNTSILYYMSEFYAPGSYKGFRYNDPYFKIKWVHEPEVITDKDRRFENFEPRSLKGSE